MQMQWRRARTANSAVVFHRRRWELFYHVFDFCGDTYWIFLTVTGCPLDHHFLHPCANAVRRHWRTQGVVPHCAEFVLDLNALAPNPLWETAMSPQKE